MKNGAGHAQASGGSFTAGNAIAASPSVVIFTQASGGQNGTYCFVDAQGRRVFSGLEESIGTTGPGNVSLRCNGQYSTSGGGLRCTAKIDD